MAARSRKKTISLKASVETLEQLNDLVEKWEESRSQVIIRCVERVWGSIIDSQRKSNDKSEE